MKCLKNVFQHPLKKEKNDLQRFPFGEDFNCIDQYDLMQSFNYDTLNSKPLIKGFLNEINHYEKLIAKNANLRLSIIVKALNDKISEKNISYLRDAKNQKRKNMDNSQRSSKFKKNENGFNSFMKQSNSPTFWLSNQPKCSLENVILAGQIYSNTKFLDKSTRLNKSLMGIRTKIDKFIRKSNDHTIKNNVSPSFKKYQSIQNDRKRIPHLKFSKNVLNLSIDNQKPKNLNEQINSFELNYNRGNILSYIRVKDFPKKNFMVHKSPE